MSADLWSALQNCFGRGIHDHFIFLIENGQIDLDNTVIWIAGRQTVDQNLPGEGIIRKYRRKPVDAKVLCSDNLIGNNVAFYKFSPYGHKTHDAGGNDVPEL